MPAKGSAGGLTNKHLEIADSYLIDLNAHKAGIRVGLTPAAARSRVRKVINRPEVKAYIDSKMEQRREKIQITAENVLQEMAKMAFFDVRKLYDEDGNLKPVSELDENTAAGVEAVEVGEYTVIDANERSTTSTRTKRVKTADKRGALSDLGKHLGLFPNKVDINLKAEVRHVYDLSGLTEEELITYKKIREKIRLIETSSTE